ncbi:MAG: OmpA family protein [bacterium]|nr:OmpA family protein [bacterium]
MKQRNQLLILPVLLFFVLLLFPVQGAGADTPQEEPLIPADAHAKAITALETLGLDRGAKSIDYKSLEILGIVTGIVSKSEKIKAALKDLGAQETDTEFRIELSGDILFDFDKWDIRPQAQKTLLKVGEIVNSSGSSHVTITGHTDAKGTEQYNRRLSEKRADSVKNWLVQKGAVKGEIIETIGLGETQPAAPNTNTDGSDNPEGRQKNRRVEISVKKIINKASQGNYPDKHRETRRGVVKIGLTFFL